MTDRQTYRDDRGDVWEYATTTSDRGRVVHVATRRRDAVVVVGRTPRGRLEAIRRAKPATLTPRP